MSGIIGTSWVSVLGDPQWWFSYWFPFKTTKHEVLSKGHPHSWFPSQAVHRDNEPHAHARWPLGVPIRFQTGAILRYAYDLSRDGSHVNRKLRVEIQGSKISRIRSSVHVMLPLRFIYGDPLIFNQTRQEP